jgi:hypothetical protein
MQALTPNSWPSARQYAEAVQCPQIAFRDPALREMLPAVDRLGLPLVTSGQFAYVFKLNGAGGGSLAVRCFRGFLGDRGERYRALDAHLAAHRLAALPRFRYLPEGVFVAGARYPALVMDWVTGPTLDVYLDEAAGRRGALLHLAGEWLRLMASLREAGVAHGDLQHGNVIVEGGRFRLVDLDGMFVPALGGLESSEVGHRHYQHPRRDAKFFSPDLDNFSALVIYLSLVALAERPSLWSERHDENLLFTREDFESPASSPLFAEVRGLNAECARLADALASAADAPDPRRTPWLLDLVEARSKLPAWITAPADVEVGGRTREVARAAFDFEAAPAGRGPRVRHKLGTPGATGFQTLFNSGGVPAAQGPAALLDPEDLEGNTLEFARRAAGASYLYIWWILPHSIILKPLWAAFGVTGVAAMFCTFLLLFAACLFYGFARAVYFAETAVRLTGGAGPTPLSAPPPSGAIPALSPATSLRVTTPARSAASPAGSVTDLFVGSRGLSIYHLPACEWAARIATRQRVDFDSAAAAQSAGYRPCRVCQP